MYFAVPPSLEAEPSGAARLLRPNPHPNPHPNRNPNPNPNPNPYQARLLRAFLSDAATGHRTPGGAFYDLTLTLTLTLP